MPYPIAQLTGNTKTANINLTREKAMKISFTFHRRKETTHT